MLKDKNVDETNSQKFTSNSAQIVQIQLNTAVDYNN